MTIEDEVQEAVINGASMIFLVGLRDLWHRAPFYVDRLLEKCGVPAHLKVSWRGLKCD